LRGSGRSVRQAPPVEPPVYQTAPAGTRHGGWGAGVARHDKTAERGGETGGWGRVDGWASWAGIPFGTRNASTRDPSGRHRRSQLSTHPTLNCLLTPVPPNAASRSSIGVPCQVGLSPPRASAITACSSSCNRLTAASFVGPDGRGRYPSQESSGGVHGRGGGALGCRRRTASSPPGGRFPGSDPVPRSSPATRGHGHSEPASRR